MRNQKVVSQVWWVWWCVPVCIVYIIYVHLTRIAFGMVTVNCLQLWPNRDISDLSVPFGVYSFICWRQNYIIEFCWYDFYSICCFALFLLSASEFSVFISEYTQTASDIYWNVFEFSLITLFRCNSFNSNAANETIFCSKKTNWKKSHFIHIHAQSFWTKFAESETTNTN